MPTTIVVTDDRSEAKEQTGDRYIRRYASRTSTTGVKTTFGKGRKRIYREYNPYDFISNRQYSGDASDGYWRDGPLYLQWYLTTRLAAVPGPSITQSPQFNSDCVNLAIFRMQDALRQGDFNLTVTGAEAKKSVQTIFDTARRLAAGAQALKRGDLGSLYKSLKVPPPPRFKSNGSNSYRYPPAQKVRESAGNLWMEARYGWVPLISDIFNALESVANILNQPSVDILSAKGSARAKSPSATYRIGQGSQDFRLDMVWQVVAEQGCNVKVAYRINNGNIANAARLGLTNPASVVWEVIPLSFVVDWFVPVGKFLNQLSAYHGLDFVRGLQSEKTKYVMDGFQELLTTKPMDTTAGVLARNFRFRRTVLTSFPFAGLFVKNPLKVTNAITAVALVQQTLGSLSKR